MGTRSFLSIVAALLLLPLAANPILAEHAQTAALQQLSRSDQADLRRVETYLRELSTLRARFVQTTSLGDYAEGEMVLARPGRIRFAYDPPNPVLIVAKNGSLLYYNRELEQASFVPLASTPLRFITDSEVDLSGDTTVLDVTRSAGTLAVTLADGDDLANGTLTLTFADDPLVLRQWAVVDPEGTVIQVALIEPQFGVPVPSSAFDTSDLDLYGLKGRDRGR